MRAVAEVVTTHGAFVSIRLKKNITNISDLSEQLVGSSQVCVVNSVATDECTAISYRSCFVLLLLVCLVWTT